MNGFSEEWLRLREPADAAARNPEIAAGLAAHLADRTKVTFVDLGCGAGANLRHTALLLPRGMRQCWRLLDHDPRLLLSARGRLAAWADKSSEAPCGALQLEKDGREIEVSFCEADLNGKIERFLQPDEIVTASAFFDLVSRDWIARFAEAVAALGSAVYAPLIYNGIQIWSPPHPADWPMLVAFNVHQRRDKGFGTAAGPGAAVALHEVLCERGYSVTRGDSSWRLGPQDANLIAMLAETSAAAVAELGLFDERAIAKWKESRLRAASCLVGHTDILALPAA
jgi:SAM-dependent methyltransferase